MMNFSQERLEVVQLWRPLAVQSERHVEPVRAVASGALLSSDEAGPRAVAGQPAPSEPRWTDGAQQAGCVALF